jgi:long-chain acyl-CoA synthetase
VSQTQVPRTLNPSRFAAAGVAEGDLPLARFDRWERERAGQVFLTQPFDGGKVREWTWAEAAAESRRMGAWLIAQNWEPGSRVAILSKNCAWWIIADLAIWMAGHVSVPIYPSLKHESARQILEHSEAKACFLGATDEHEMAGFAMPPNVQCITFPTIAAGPIHWDTVIASASPLSEYPARSPEELATIIYTSGTTGIPKGVMHAFGALSYNAKVLVEQLDLTADQRILSYLPLAHIVERVGVECLTLFLGSQLFFTEGLETFITDLQRARPTIFLSVPRLLTKFQQNVFAKIPKPKLDFLFRVPIVGRVVKQYILRQLGLSTVRHAACGAAPLPPETLAWYRALGLNLTEGYGTTETLITHLPQLDAVRPAYVGTAIRGVETELGEDDELLIRSPMNMLGYYKDPAGTQSAFRVDGFFRTGDIVHIDPDGQLKIVGRLKEQFKTSKGKYVAPAPIECKLARHPAVEACCLMGSGLASPFAVVLLSEDARQKCTDPQAKVALEQSLEKLIQGVNAQLDPHERVAFLAIVDGPWTVGNGFLTPTLKLKRSVLEQHYQEKVQGWRGENRLVVWESPAA